MALNQLKFDQLETGSVYPITASYALSSSAGNGGTTLITGSTYPITSSWAANSLTGAYSVSSSISTNALTASFSDSSSFAYTAVSGAYSSTASVALNALTASYLDPISQSLIPSTGSTYSLGSPTNKWKDLYVSTGSIYIGDTVLSTSGSTLFANASPVVTLNTASGQIEVSGITASLSASYSDNSGLFNNTSSTVFATTGSNIFNGNQTVQGNITVIGSLIAQQYVVSSSVSYFTSSNFDGSTKFGDTESDIHQFTGSLRSPNITGSLLGTASIALIALTSSYINVATNAVSSSFANTASVSISSSFASTSSYNLNSISSSYSLTSVSSSYSNVANTATSATNANTATSSSYATTAGTATSATSANSANTANSATSASYSLSSSYSVNSNTSVSSSFASTASYNLNSVSSSFSTTSSYNLNSISSSYSLTASFALNGGGGGTTLTTGSTYPITSSWATNAITASYALNSAGGGGGGSVQTGNIANQTILYNVTTSQDNVISGLNLTGNKWGVTVVEEWNSASVAGDLNYSSCSLLMHFSGSDGSTTFTDNSPTPKSFTRGGNAQVSTVQSKFGGSSLYLDGSGDYITTTYNSTAFDWWTTDYTIECFIYPNNSSSLATGTVPVLIGNMDPGGSGANYWSFGPNNSKQLSFYYFNGAGIYVTSTETVTVGQWNHIAATKNSTGIRLFINGTASVSSASVSGTPGSSVSYPLTIGQYYNASINAYVDEVRITKGVARYTASFTVPNSAFPDTQGTTPQYATKYIGLVGGINDSTVDYGVEKLSDSSLKIRKMTASGQPLSGSGALSASVDRVYVNVLDYTNVMVTSSYALTASYVLGGIQTGSISNQTILYNVTTSQDNTITGLDLSGNKWDVSVIEEWNSGSVIGDDYYNSCSLLMHFSGSNGSTTFVDNSPRTKTFTVNGDSKISTTQYKFISSSLYLDGTGDYLSTNSSNDFAFGTGDFTIECWFYSSDVSAASGKGLFQTSDTVGGLKPTYTSGIILIQGSNNVAAGLNGGLCAIIAGTTLGSTTAVITTNTWYHIALVRNSGTSTIYLNGTSIGSATTTGNCIGTYLSIGGFYSTSYLYQGYMDEVRITKGVARYTGSFVPPTSEFPDNLNVTQLQTKYIGLVGGLNDSNVDYGVEKLSDTSLKIRKMTASGQPLSGSGALSASVDRVYVNVLNYKEVQTTAQSASYAVTSSYTITSVTSSFALSASYLIPTSNNTTKAIFGYGYTSAAVSMTNLVNNTGVVANDVTGVGSARHTLAATGYGVDKAIFGYGYTSVLVSITNLVSNTGVVATDTTGVGTARDTLAAAGYGSDKAIFGYGNTGANVSMTNLISNTGVVATDTTGVGTARSQLAAAGYGTDKAIFGYGLTGAVVSMTNLVSNTGVVATDTTGVGSARRALAAAGYGSDKAIFGYGYTSANVSITNLVSSTGVVATDTTGVGSVRHTLAAAEYGRDNAIFGYGFTSAGVSMTNLVSNIGVVANDTTGIGTARYWLAAAGYSTT